jgi:hypothetical protein
VNTLYRLLDDDDDDDNNNNNKPTITEAMRLHNLETRPRGRPRNT